MIEAYPNKPGKSNIVSTSFRRTLGFSGNAGDPLEAVAEIEQERLQTGNQPVLQGSSRNPGC
jgi:hypothetical protein